MPPFSPPSLDGVLALPTASAQIRADAVGQVGVVIARYGIGQYELDDALQRARRKRAKVIAQCRALMRVHRISCAELHLDQARDTASAVVPAPPPPPLADVRERAKPPAPRVTHCPSPPCDLRYQVPPGTRVDGAGFVAAGIGRDIRTGTSWGATAPP